MARTEGQWIKGLDFITPHENVPVLLKNEYLNFGGFFIGETGFGFRNNAGVMEYKDEAGVWTPFSAAVGGGVNVETIAINGTATYVSANLAKWIDTEGGHFYEGFGYSVSGSGPYTYVLDLMPFTFIRLIY